MIKITIPGKPIAKARPRFSFKTKRAYNSQVTEEGLFLLQIQEQAPVEPLPGPLAVSFRFFMKRPDSHYGTGRNAGKLKPSAPAHHIKKPDFDNLVKFAADCLNDIAWRDDAQIVQSSVIKEYSERPRTEINIEPVAEAKEASA